jgi:endonuclease YncB( thermonuclease family)
MKYLILVFLLLTSCQPETYTVTKVIDWDTIKTSEHWSIRLADIDAPESTKYRYWYTECWGEEASLFLEWLITWQEVIIQEVGKDLYWRTLAQVYYGPYHVNELMVEKWYAKAYENAPANILILEAQAQEQKLWMWWCE